MTAKQRVKAVYPSAFVTRYRKQMGGGYSLVWSRLGSAGVRLGEGHNERAAWVDAAKKLKGPT